MIRLILILISFISFTTISSQDNCYDIIKQMAEQDKCLSSRAGTKSRVAKQSNNSWSFGLNMLRETKCNGTYYACGMTRAWTSEVWEGIFRQYKEWKNDDGLNGTNAGYVNLIGQNLIDHFTQMRASTNNRVIYHMRHSGTHDHVWVVEQLPEQGGYRIYQSYQDAYSLKAWLSTSLEGLFGEEKDIKIFTNVQKTMNDTILKITSGKISFNNLDKIADELKAFLPFLIYVRDYNQTTTMDNFKKSWEAYGKGKILDWTSFRNYLGVLSNHTSSLNSSDWSNAPFSQTAWDDWVLLFASPNPLYYPGLPTNALISMMMSKTRAYRFEVLPVVVEPFPNCTQNRDFILVNTLNAGIVTNTSGSQFTGFSLLIIFLFSLFF